MALPTGLTRSALREVELGAMTGRLPSPEVIEAMAETLITLLDESSEATDIDDLHGIITKLEAEITDAVKEKNAFETKCEEAKKAILEAKELVAATADEWKALAEKTEHEAATLRELHASSAGERARFEADARRLSAVLLGIVDGKPEEAWKTACLALGRDVEPPTASVATIPSRSERRRMIRKAGL